MEKMLSYLRVGNGSLAPNKSLKAFASLTGTVQTGAASHYRAGSACPLALRYTVVKLWVDLGYIFNEFG